MPSRGRWAEKIRFVMPISSLKTRLLHFAASEMTGSVNELGSMPGKVPLCPALPLGQGKGVSCVQSAFIPDSRNQSTCVTLISSAYWRLVL